MIVTTHLMFWFDLVWFRNLWSAGYPFASREQQQKYHHHILFGQINLWTWTNVERLKDGKERWTGLTECEKKNNKKKWYTFEIREGKLSIENEEWQHDVYSRERLQFLHLPIPCRPVFRSWSSLNYSNRVDASCV